MGSSLDELLDQAEQCRKLGFFSAVEAGEAAVKRHEEVQRLERVRDVLEDELAASKEAMERVRRELGASIYHHLRGRLAKFVGTYTYFQTMEANDAFLDAMNVGGICTRLLTKQGVRGG